MKVKDFKELLDSLDPEANLFINETYHSPFRTTKAKIVVPSIFRTIGKLGKDGNIVMNAPMEKCAYIYIENYSSEIAVNGFNL